MYEQHPSLLLVVAMMKLPPARDLMEQAFLAVFKKSKVWGLGSIYEALVVGLRALDGQTFPLWFLNAGGVSYALGYLVWLKKVGIIRQSKTTKAAPGAVRLGECSTLHLIQPCSAAVLQKLELVAALDLPARACQLRPSEPRLPQPCAKPKRAAVQA